MTKEKDDKYKFSALSDFKGYSTINNSRKFELLLPTSLELREGEPELAFQILEEAFIEEEVEIPIDLYNEIKKISDEIDLSVANIIKGALGQYISKYRKTRKRSN